jgi:N-acetylmuramic acid 6-phosphate etherase
MALNIISTGVMVRLGKVYGNRMVDVAVTNAKLQDRALRILADLAGKDRQQAMALLTQTNGSVKLALFVAATARSVADARSALEVAGGSLASALAAAGVQLKGPQ